LLTAPSLSCSLFPFFFSSTTEVKEFLKAQGVVEAVNKISADNGALDDVKRQCKAVIDALMRTDFQFTAVPLSSIKMKDLEVKSAKALFGDDQKKIETVTELPENVRNLLLAGSLMMKHSNTAAPRQRHVYITPDLKFLVWKDVKKVSSESHEHTIQCMPLLWGWS